jgi:hypothetical protein
MEIEQGLIFKQEKTDKRTLLIDVQTVQHLCFAMRYLFREDTFDLFSADVKRSLIKAHNKLIVEIDRDDNTA